MSNLNYYNYFTEIEDTFVRRRGKNLLLSPLDWAMIEGWQQRGIPLHVVIRAIETVFDAYDKKPAQPRAIKSLFYCREEVEAQFLEWSASQTGKQVNETSPLNDNTKELVVGLIDEVIGKLEICSREELLEDIGRAVVRLTELRENLPEDLALVEPVLFDIEKFLNLSLMTNAIPEHLTSIKKEITLQLKPMKATVGDGEYQRTFDIMLAKRLRDDAGIPRLSLFL